MVNKSELEKIILESGFEKSIRNKNFLDKKSLTLYIGIQNFIEDSLNNSVHFGLNNLNRYMKSKFNIKEKYELKLNEKEIEDNLDNLMKSFSSLVKDNELDDGIEKIYSFTKYYNSLDNNCDDLIDPVIGNKKAKKVLKKIETIYSKYDVKSEENPLSQKIDFPKSIFLYGPPGTGKTTMIRNTINRIKSNVDFIVKDNFIDSSFKSKWYGETIKNLEETLLNTKDSSKLFVNVLDDIDLLFPKRDYDGIFVEKEILNSFMRYFDEIDYQDNILNFITSNSPSKIDSALIQRISQKNIFVPGPQTESEYSDALKLHFNKSLSSNNCNITGSEWSKLSKYLMDKNYSGREIKDLAHSVYLDLICNDGSILDLNYDIINKNIGD